MPIASFESQLPSSAQELFAWHARPGAFERLCPPWRAIKIERPAPIEVGSRVHLRMRRGPFDFRWIAEHTELTPGRSFVDIQRSGPFARWIHRHEFEDTAGGALLRDRIDYELPGGALGRALAGRAIARDLAATFAFRHEATSRDLARHRAFAEHPRLRVAISGASGLMGSALAPFLTSGGHQVVKLVRGHSAGDGEALWRPDAGLARPESLPSIEAVVHLAGENLAAGRWTQRRKALIERSRIEGTRCLVRSLARVERRPATLVCASAVGVYGDRGDTLLDEASEPGSGFLAETCRAWEAAAEEAERLGIRVVQLRFGIVLSPAGGALAKMLPPFRLGVGGPIGDGRQFMSWVSLDDAVGAIHHALMEPSLSGPVNAVAPAAVSNRQFSQALGAVLRRPALLPIPRAAARLALGEMADEMLLASTRVRPAKLERSGFAFHDRDLGDTLSRLLGRVSGGN